MYRIGLIGTENSHSMGFARYFNLPRPDGTYNEPDCRVVGVYGPDPDSTKAIMDAVGVEFIAQDTDEFIGKVDALMITCRKGSLHRDHAVKFIAHGLPLFVDKPFTSDIAEALDLIAAAKEAGVPLVGGSSVKYSPDIPELHVTIDAGRADGSVAGATIHYAADTDSIYDGFWFYASHAVELMLELFGTGVRSIAASRAGRSITAVARYDDVNVTLQYAPDCYQCGLLLAGKNGSSHRILSMDRILETEAAHFCEMLRTGRPNQTPEALVRPVFVIDAILRAADTGRAVDIELH